MIAIAFTLFFFTVFIINTIIFKRIINYLNLFMLIWSSIAVLSTFGFYNFFTPPNLAYFYILLFLVTLEISSIVFLKVRIKTSMTKRISEPLYYKQLNWKRLNYISILCTLIMMPFAIKGLKVILSEGIYRLRISGFSDVLYTTSQKLLLMNIVQPLIITIAIFSIIDFVFNKKLRISLLITILNCLLYICIFGGRWILLEFVLLTCIIMISKYRLNLIEIVNKNKFAMISVAVIVIVMVVITYNRSVSGGSGIFYNIYVYFVGSIHLLGVYINSPDYYLLNGDNFLYGKELLSGVLQPLIIILQSIGFDIKSGIEILNQTTQQYSYVSPNTIMNNNVTLIYPFLRDYGILSLIINTIVLAAIYSYIYLKKVKRSGIVFNSAYYFSVSLIPFLILEWMFARMSIILVFLFLFLLTRKPFRRTENEEKNNAENNMQRIS